MAPKDMDYTRAWMALADRLHYSMDGTRKEMAPKYMDGTRTQMALRHRWHLSAWMAQGYRWH